MRRPHDDAARLRTELLGDGVFELEGRAGDSIAAIAATGRIDRHDEVLHGDSSSEG